MSVVVLAYDMVEEGRADLGVARGKIVLHPNRAVEMFVPSDIFSLRQYPRISNSHFIIPFGYGWFVRGSYQLCLFSLIHLLKDLPCNLMILNTK